MDGKQEDFSAYNKLDPLDSVYRFYTRYPDQKNMMGYIIDCCMKWMPYPNHQIAVIAGHALISALGGRVYTFNNGSGIVLTALVTGRSTIGKSFIKKFCIWVLNGFQDKKCSKEFIGSYFYTGSKNMINEMKRSGSLLSVRTESGQNDKSNVGDITRVLMYELELATESGEGGYISSGGQSRGLPALYSPAVTTIRESVAKIQSEADIIRASAISGVSGRRSHVLIDPVKGDYNEQQISEVPDKLKALTMAIYKKAIIEQRKNVTEPLHKSLWVRIRYKDPEYLSSKRKEWIKKENLLAANNYHFTATFYGRLGERLPSWAARLAIADNPKRPVITNEHIDIAEESLFAELAAATRQHESGELDSDITETVNFIMNLFKGDMTKHRSILRDGNQHMLMDKACELHRVFSRARVRVSYKKAALRHSDLDKRILQAIKIRGLEVLPPRAAKITYNYYGKVLRVPKKEEKGNGTS